jgi:hypothetical protein
MAKLSAKQLKVKAILDAIGERIRSGGKLHSNHDFEAAIKAMGYSYKQAEKLIVKLAEPDVRRAYIKSFHGHLPVELKAFQDGQEKGTWGQVTNE